MATEVVLPMLGITVERGKITQWHKSEGDSVQKAEIIFTVESEKVTTDVESPATGILAKILVQAGMEVPLMTVVGIITEPGEEVPPQYLSAAPPKNAGAPEKIATPQNQEAKESGPPAAPSGGPVRIVPAARKLAKEMGIEPARIRGTGPEGIICWGDVVNTAPGETGVKASTLAKRLATQNDVDLSAIQGTGVRGRIMRDDVAGASLARIQPGAGAGIEKIIPLNGVRRVIARRMSQSAFSAPHTYFFTEVAMDALLDYRRQVAPVFEKRFGIRPSINDFLIKAVALNIRDFPLFNAQIEDENIHILPRINVGLAVAQPEGLIVPAIADADLIGLAEIALQRNDLVSRARTGQLTGDEMERGTFTISSLAQYDITQFTAIINPPQSAILSVAATRDQLFLQDGQVAVRKTAVFGLSTDHRVIDGVQSADFLQNLKAKLERPAFTFMHL